MLRICTTVLLSVAIVPWFSLPALGFPISANGDADQMSLIGRWSEGPCRSVVAKGDTLIFHHGGIVEIIDYSNPLAPIQVSQIEVPTYPLFMTLSANLLVVGGPHDLAIIDVVDLSTPVIAENVILENTIEGLTAIDGWIYANQYNETTYGQEIVPIDINDPSHPIVYGPILAPMYVYWDDIAADENRLVCAGGYSSWVYDLSTPASPTLLGQAPLDYGGHTVLVSGGLAYVVSLDNDIAQIDILDISGPGDPMPVGQASWSSLSWAWSFTGLSIQGTILYMVDEYGVAYSLDVTNPSTPTLLSSLEIGQPSTDIAVTSSRAFLPIDYDPGLMVVDVGDPSNLSTIETLEFGKPLYGVTVDFNRAYVYAHYDMVDILDVTDPESPVKIGRVDTGDGVWGFDAHGDYLYVSNDLSMIRVYDVSTPSTPILTDQLGVGHYDEFLTYRNGIVYIGGNGGITLVNVNDPYNVQEISVVPLGGSPVDFDIEGRSLYGISYGSPAVLSIIDIGDPSSPQIDGSMTFQGEGSAIAVEGALAYVVVDSLGGEFGEEVVSSSVKIIDVSNSLAPISLSSFSIPTHYVNSGQTGKGVVVDHGFLYAAAGDKGVLVYDVSDPYLPVEFGYFNSGYHGSGLDYEFGRIFLADARDGLYILENTEVQPTGVGQSLVPMILTQNFPNPFNPQTTIAFDMPSQTAVRLAVYDVSGRLVNVLLDNDIAAQGRNEVLWRGRDSGGRIVPAGVYFYRLEAGSFSETKRMVLVK